MTLNFPIPEKTTVFLNLTIPLVCLNSSNKARDVTSVEESALENSSIGALLWGNLSEKNLILRTERALFLATEEEGQGRSGV